MNERLFEDDTLLFNMSVWQSLEALKGYVYESRHVHFVKYKKNWFDKIRDHHLALWWIQEGHIPTVEEAVERLALLRQNGPGEQAFTFSRPFSPADSCQLAPDQ